MQPHALHVLRFAALFLWADLHIADAEQQFLHALARELGVLDPARVAELLASPPSADEVDPTRVPPALARKVRDVALRAIASDGRVEPGEMALFHLLDELLPDEGDGPHQPS
jgi:tellurite resistance protein